MKRCLYALVVVSLLLGAAHAAAQGRPYYRQPALSPDGATIAFVYAGDIYTVPAQGGSASLLVSNAAYDSYPRFSPDGAWLAFTSTRTGGGDVYVISRSNGELRRLTWFSGEDQVEGWSSDSRWVYFSSGRHDINGNPDIYRVAIAGGTPVAVSRDRYESEYNAKESPDGTMIAFNNNERVRHWWRKGPRVDEATDVWVRGSAPDAGDYRQITTYEGKDSWPLWAPDGAGLYFVTDEGSDRGVENIAYQSLNGARRLVTSFTDGRVMWPDIARTGDIVFEREFGIWLLPAGGSPRAIAITAFADDKGTPVTTRTYTNQVQGFELSPDGKKVAFTVHGEVFAAPASVGPDEQMPPAFRVTRTAAPEGDLAWCKDSTRLIYSSQRAGSADLYVYDFAKREEKRLTQHTENDGNPVVSPDGKWCAFMRGNFELRMLNLEDYSERAFAGTNWLSPGIAWSPDSAWVVFTDMDDQYFTNLFVKRVTGDDKPLQITYLPHIGTYAPAWSADGRFIMFTTQQNRLEGMVMRVDLQSIEQKFDEQKFDDLFSPPPAKPTGQEKKEEGAKPDEKKATEEKKVDVRIIIERIRQRLTRMVPFATNAAFYALSPDDKKFLYVNNPSGTAVLWVANADPSAGPGVRQLATGNFFGAVQFAPDKSTVWYQSGGTIFSIPLAGGAPKPYSFSAEMDIDFDQEKLAAYREAWLHLRDSFADGSFNKQDFQALYDRYLPYFVGARTMTDFVVLGNLLQGDLNASHMGMSYFEGGDTPSGDLGLDFDPVELLKSGHFRIAEVIEEGPVAREHANIKAGQYLIAVDGVKLSSTVNLEELLVGTIGKRVKLTFAAGPDGANGTDLDVKPVSSGQVNNLRYDAWVRANRAYVEKISGGKLGYVHIPNMGTSALENFKIDLDSENYARDGVVIDIRYNNGGWVASFIADIIGRKVTHYQTFRGRGRTPSERFVGNYVLGKPTVLLQNEQSLSNAENFAETYRQMGLGKIVGTRSCGWLIFTWGTQLINGVNLRLPRFQNLTLDGEDMDEVARTPDVFIDRPIGQSLTGQDDQLDMAVKVLLEQIRGK